MPDRDRIHDIEVFGPNQPYSVIHDRNHKGLDPHGHYIDDDKTHRDAHELTREEQDAYDSYKDD